MDLSERLARFRNLFHDRPGQFAASFDAVLADGGIKVADPAPLPAGEPAHIACAELGYHQRASPRVSQPTQTTRTEVNERLALNYAGLAGAPRPEQGERTGGAVGALPRSRGVGPCTHVPA